MWVADPGAIGCAEESGTRMGMFGLCQPLPPVSQFWVRVTQQVYASVGAGAG